MGKVQEPTTLDQAEAAATALDIEKKILHLMRIYPIVSHTMLQGGLGPYIKPAIWRPVLSKLIAEGKVIEEQDTRTTHANRFNTYTKLHLPGVTVEGLPDENE